MDEQESTVERNINCYSAKRAGIYAENSSGYTENLKLDTILRNQHSSVSSVHSSVGTHVSSKVKAKMYAGQCVDLEALLVTENEIKGDNMRKTLTKGAKRGLVLVLIIVIAVFVFLYTALGIRNRLAEMYTVGLKSTTYNNLKPFQPEVTEDFPTVSEGEPRIPHILHQTYKSEHIPLNFKNNLISFIKWNPTWTYYLWTDDSARKLIQERHPYLLDVWDHYRKPINRADALRYVVLYEFGGMYADLDVEFLRPLDRVTMKYACIFPTEPFEHSAFRIGSPFLLSNAIMMCRPKHPFIAKLLQNLAKSVVLLEQIDIAGPSFVTYNFLIYNQIDDIYKQKTTDESNSPYFYKGELPEDDINAVYVPNTVYFIDTLDEHHGSEENYYKTCAQIDSQTDLIKRACLELSRRGFHREKNDYTFTIHQWYQSYNPAKLIKYFPGVFGEPVIHISKVIPSYVKY